jgi:hypothetical protein
MPQEPPPRDPEAAAAPEDAIAVISAYGAFRLLLVLLAVWTFFAGFSLLTQGVGALSFGGGAAAERVAGAYMIVLAPIYGLIAWRRDDYRWLIWVPYAAQLAVIIPTFYDLLISHDGHFQDSALMLIVSLTFFVLLVYLWWSSHPVHHFLGAADEGEEWEEGDEEYEDDGDAEAGDDTRVPGRGRPPDDGARALRPPV